MNAAPLGFTARFVLLASLVVIAWASPSSAQPIPGPSVNMVSGTEWPGGDPFLQRQNEGSIAVSTRNPLHLLAGGNDYRTVDIPGLPGAAMSGDAWNGLFWSRDGGNKWKSTLVAGYPQDTSAAGLASPIHGLQAGADSVVRAGANGMMFFVGIAFNREAIDQNASGSGKTGKLFITRFIDDNAKETGNPFRDLGTGIVDHGSDGRFMDKPWQAVDKPRPGGGVCSIPASGDIDAQSFPAGNIYIAYTVFVSNNPNFLRTKLMFARSADCGVTWTHQKLSEGYPINQGAVIAIEPVSGTVYVTWRRFRTEKGDTDGFLIAKSVDGGQTFTKAVEVQTFSLFTLLDGTTQVSRVFDQGTSIASFRTTGFPALVVDGNGIVYVAWSERGRGQYGAARVMVKRSADGLNWVEPAFAIDTTSSLGHQIMPSALFHGGKVAFLYYNLVEDSTIGQLLPTGEVRVPAGNLATTPPEESTVFNDFVADFAPAPPPTLKRRHTADIWIAQASPTGIANAMSFTSTRVSRYVFGEDWNPVTEPSGIVQYQFNPPNFPLFACNGELGNCRAFIGDYVDIAGAPPLVPNGTTWEYNLDTRLSRVFHAVWTDNRDVRPPADGQWQNYTPPNSPFSDTLPSSSLFDPSQARPGCMPAGDGFTHAGMRNQNLYTSRITEGLVAGSPQNAKQLGYTTIEGETFLLQRAFVVFVQNLATATKTFRLHIVTPAPGVTASFLQFELLTDLFVNVPAKSTATRSVFVTSALPDVSVRVDVQEFTAPNGNPVPDGLQSIVLLNPDITNPDITNPDITNPDITNPDITNAEVYNPDITNPDITNPDITNPDITNPDITNPDITNPDITNPDITNVSVYNPDITNPDITNPDITNPDITNPDITNPDITNPDITNGAMTEATWTVTDDGNTTAGYKVKLLVNGSVPPDFKTQLIIHRGYSTPVAVGCELAVQRQTVLVANIPNPTFTNLFAPDITNPDITNPDVTNATLYVGPGDDWVQITLRIADENPGSGPTPEEFLTTSVTPAVVAQAVNTLDVIEDSTTPPVAIPGFVVTNVADTGPGSLRQAIVDANGNGPAVDLVRFEIPGGGPHTIVLQTALPALSTAIVLDAATQPGYAGTPLVVLDGASAGAEVSGLNLTGGSAIVRGLAITRFSGSGIDISSAGNTVADSVITGNATEGISIHGATASGNVVTGNLIGVTATGSAGNAHNGINIVDSPSNRIGGPTAAERNVISANGFEGLRISGALATGNLVQGNFIGTDASGSGDLGNARSGVYIRRAPANSVVGNVVSGNDGFSGVAICGTPLFCGGEDDGTPGNLAAGNVVRSNTIGLNALASTALGNSGNGVSIDGSPNNVVGGPPAADANVIGGNAVGIYLFGNSPDDNLIRGNYIGTDATGTPNFGNAGAGVLIASGLRNIVSGVDEDRTAPNVIKFNGTAGIAVVGGTDNKLRINRFESNGGPAILLSGTGNDLQPAPVLTDVTVEGSVATISGTLNSTPNTTFTIDFYVSPSCDASGAGEGSQWFGATTVTTIDNGLGAFSTGFGGGVVQPGQVVTALATEGDFVNSGGGAGSTSAFSNCRPEPDLVVESLTHSPANPTTNDLITFTAVVRNIGAANANPSTLMFKIGGETPGDPDTLFAVPPLAPGASFTVVRQSTLIAQPYRNTATADFDASAFESDESNNTTIDDYTVSPPPIIEEEIVENVEMTRAGADFERDLRPAVASQARRETR